MAMSVKKNSGAVIALQNLSKNNRTMQEVQLRVATALNVNGPKVDVSTFAIAQNIRGDIAGMRSLRITFGFGYTRPTIATNPGMVISIFLIEMKAKSIQETQADLV